jgi:hypothetical protein
VLALPFVSNSAHELQNVELVHVSHGYTQSSHVFDVPFPYVPEGQSFVHLVPTKNRAAVLPHRVQLALFVVRQAPQFASQGWQILFIST